MDETSRTKHVVIVGAGPIGLEMAVALSKHNIDFTILEAGSVGHTIGWWAPQTRWFSSNERIAIAGVPLLTPDQSKASREQYLTYLRSVATQFELRIRTHTKVTGIRRLADGTFHVDSESSGGKEETFASAIVLAIGGTDFPKRLNIPGEELPHVDGYLRETHRYYGRRVLIIGGRNSAIEAALRLHHAGADVMLSYRGKELPEESIKYWLLPELKGLMAAGRIGDFLGTEPVKIFPSGVQLRSVSSGQEFDVTVDDVLSLIGYEQDKSLLRLAGVELTDDSLRPVFDSETMETNVSGIYVAGTATAGTQSSKYKIFLENCHSHVDQILKHLTGHAATCSTLPYQRQIQTQPES